MLADCKEDMSLPSLGTREEGGELGSQVMADSTMYWLHTLPGLFDSHVLV